VERAVLGSAAGAMTDGMTINPFFLVMALVGIAGGLFSLSERWPSGLPIICAVSLIALILRVLYLSRENAKKKSPEIALDFDKLRQKDVARYAPWLKENVRGHDEALDLIVKRISQNLRLAGPQRTLGSFMLVGPTGTGKTFLAELVGKALYPESEPLVLNMNQYTDHNDVFTLIGPPPGQPGYEIGGTITRPLLENPYRTILLDEIEKSHLDVQHCLYDVLDTASCREKSSGKTVYFGASAIFATCNAGVESLREIYAQTKDPAARAGRARDALARDAGFERALLARFDEIVLLDELQPIFIAQVACLQLAKYWRQYGIEVTYAAPELLVEAMRKNEEFKEYGVRQLAHFIQELTDPGIEEARRNGRTNVRLNIDGGTGQITIA
jgi:ATP-dependent Clp protease ATP-binding subunit ClpC